MWNAPKNLAKNYSEFVNECLTDETKFQNFKSTVEYVSIVGTPSPHQLSHMMQKINKHPKICDMFDKFRNNDLYGNPLFMIPEYNLSMGTIRYLFSLADIKTHFDSLDNMTIAELGIGYGGLAFVINTFYKPKSYHLIDLPDVQQLALKYLTLLDISATILPPPQEIDLFISEFCISEFDDEDLYKFYEQYVKNAKNVFLTMNLLEESRKQKFIRRMNEDFNLTIIPESHGSHFPTYIIIGKQ